MAATAASDRFEDEQIVQEYLRDLKRPNPIQQVDVEFGEDSTGDPAVWIWLRVAPNFQPSKPEQMQVLSRYARSVRDGLLERRIQRWPYVRFRESN